MNISIGHNFGPVHRGCHAEKVSRSVMGGL